LIRKWSKHKLKGLIKRSERGDTEDKRSGAKATLNCAPPYVRGTRKRGKTGATGSQKLEFKEAAYKGKVGGPRGKLLPHQTVGSSGGRGGMR